eukprot:m.22334 g.22334  ORF g.22334 m.22334 type:complete len:228 (+) comp13775_c1_seq1:17-700(+)
MATVLLFVGFVSVAAAQNPAFNYVTCGSSLKLAHVKTGARLHSHEVKYGSGGHSSGQNSVTGMMTQIDSNSLWKVVSPSTAQGDCPSGAPIRCGKPIRLQHVTSGCMLHSHAQFKSPLTKSQEVSGLGCPSSPNHGNGDIDPGDDWILHCSHSSDFWMRDDQVALQHAQTSRYLHHDGKTAYQRPIDGQREIGGISTKDEFTMWIAQEGIYVKRTDGTKKSQDHEEL